MPYYLYPSIYAISIIAGLINFKKFKQNKIFKVFLYFLVYTFFSEIVAVIMTKYFIISSGPIYSVWNFLNLLFYAYFIYNILSSRLKRKIIKFLVFVFVIITLINFTFYVNFFSDHVVYNTIMAKLIVVIFTLLFFTEIIQSDKLLEIKNSLYFWIIFGVFLYNIGFLPAFALVKYTSYIGIFRFITLTLNIVMHSCFIIGFFKSQKKFNNLMKL